MTIALIAAVARNRVIGRDNQLIWRIKADLRHFRDLTLGKPVIMGRKTFESIGKPLPGRDNIVISRDARFAVDGIHAVVSLEAALALAAELNAARNGQVIMVAGGGEIYTQAMARADRLYMTEVDLEPEGDTMFPVIDRTIWRETSRKSHPKGPDDDAAYAFVDYVRR